MTKTKTKAKGLRRSRLLRVLLALLLSLVALYIFRRPLVVGLMKWKVAGDWDQRARLLVMRTRATWTPSASAARAASPTARSRRPARLRARKRPSASVPIQPA